uniref:BAR domain-containing protein n=1 Tax=Sphaeramia orbicularis TaxID=375764 RepID=A0A673CDK4_9TELE
VVMDLTRLAVDAGQFINRAVQYTEETLGQADRTELDPGLEELLNRADATKTWTDQIISQTEVLLQPNAGARLEDRLYEQLDWHVPPRPRTHEVLGEQLTHAGLELGSTTPYGSALIRCGEVQKQLGEAERKFVQSTNIHFLTPLRSFTEGQYRAIQDERKTLVNKRLDLDIAKSRLRKAHEADRESRVTSYVLNGSSGDTWAEMELRICQSLFDRQSEITKQLLDGLSNTHTNHMRSLVDFVEAQACYFAQCNQHAQELQKQLGRCRVNSLAGSGRQQLLFMLSISMFVHFFLLSSDTLILKTAAPSPCSTTHTIRTRTRHTPLSHLKEHTHTHTSLILPKKVFTQHCEQNLFAESLVCLSLNKASNIPEQPPPV